MASESITEKKSILAFCTVDGWPVEVLNPLKIEDIVWKTSVWFSNEYIFLLYPMEPALK